MTTGILLKLLLIHIFCTDWLNFTILVIPLLKIGIFPHPIAVNTGSKHLLSDNL
jgi:hypothetical protein